MSTTVKLNDTVTVTKLFRDLKFKEIKEKINEFNLKLKEIKQEIKQTIISKNDEKRNDLYHEKYLYSKQITNYFHELNILQGKRKSHIFKRNDFHDDYSNLKYFKPENLLLIYVYDNNIFLFELHSVQQTMDFFTKKLQIDVLVKDILLNKNMNLIGTTNIDNTLIKIEKLDSSQHFIFSKNYFLNEIDYKNIVKDNLQVFDIYQRSLTNLDEFYNKLLKWKNLLLLEKEYKLKREEILNS